MSPKERRPRINTKQEDPSLDPHPHPNLELAKGLTLFGGGVFSEVKFYQFLTSIPDQSSSEPAPSTLEMAEGVGWGALGIILLFAGFATSVDSRRKLRRYSKVSEQQKSNKRVSAK